MSRDWSSRCPAASAAPSSRSASAACCRPDELLVVANTGDDFEHLGLQYLAGYRHADLHAGRPRQSGARLGPARRDLVVHGDARRARRRDWFRLGDRDLAVHVERTRRLRGRRDAVRGSPPTSAARLGVGPRVLPMSDDPVRTRVRTDDGWIDFQDYFVRRQCGPVVRELAFRRRGHGARAAGCPGGAERSGAARRRDLPVQSVHQRRADPGRAGHARGAWRLRGARRRGFADHRRPAVKGPTAKMMAELGMTPSAARVAQRYGDLLDGYVWTSATRTRRRGSRPRCTLAPTLMTSSRTARHWRAPSLTLRRFSFRAERTAPDDLGRRARQGTRRRQATAGAPAHAGAAPRAGETMMEEVLEAVAGARPGRRSWSSPSTRMRRRSPRR